MKKAGLVMVVGIILIMGILIALACFDNPIRYHVVGQWSAVFNPDFDYWESEGDKIIKTLDTYKRTHGKYPESLKQLNGVEINTIYGPWHYKNYGDNYRIVLGEYGVHEWEFKYCSNLPGWTIDT